MNKETGKEEKSGFSNQTNKIMVEGSRRSNEKIPLTSNLDRRFVGQAKRLRRLAAAGLVLAGTAAGCKPEEKRTPIITPEPTYIKPTEIPPSPTIEYTPTIKPTTEPEESPVQVPTPTAAIEFGVGEMAVGGEENDILRNLEIVRYEIDKIDFDKNNPGCRLLVSEGIGNQASIELVDKDKNIYASGNFNLPLFPDDLVEFQPSFNNPDCVFMMSWVDKDGNWFYHTPLREGKSGQSLAVYQKNNILYEAFLDKNGVIDELTENEYWHSMPEKAIKSVMAKFGNAVYVTFYNREGEPITFTKEEIGDKTAEVVDLNDGKGNSWAAIKVSNLPLEPTPTKEPTVTKEPTTTPTPEKIEKVFVDVNNYLEGVQMQIVDQKRLDEAISYFFKIKYEKTSGWVTALLLRGIPGTHQYNNVQVEIDLSKGIKFVFRDREKMTAEETKRFEEGINMNSDNRARYDTVDGRLTIEIFRNIYKSEYLFTVDVFSSLLELIDLRLIDISSSNEASELYRILMGDWPKGRGGINFNPCIKSFVK